MRVLVITHHFWPENFKINDFVDGLIDRSHELTILTGKPNYPKGYIYPKFKKKPKDFKKYRSAEILRVPIIPRGSSRIQLFLNYLSFSFSLSIFGSFMIRKKKFDRIIVFGVSPISVAIPAIIISKLKNIPVFLWVLDLWPDTLTAVGFKSKVLLKLVHHMVNFIYRRSAMILVPTNGAVKKIKNDFKLSSKVIFFPGWAEELFNDDEAGRSVIPLNNNFFNIVFTGNVGEAQDFSSLIKVAKKCKHIDSVKWHIVGDGRMKSWIENEILENSLENTIYTYGNFDISKMPAILESADALLIALKNNPIFEVTIPGKFQTYCTAGKPIISLAKGEVNKIVDDINAGVTGDSDNLDEFAKKIIDLSKMPIDKLKDMGKNASSFAKKEFNRDHLIDRFEDCFVHHEMEK